MPNSNGQVINDHFENNSSIDSNGALKVKDLNKLNRKLNEGKPFFGDILKFALTQGRLPTDAEISKMPTQSENTVPRTDKNNSKEKKNMNYTAKIIPWNWQDQDNEEWINNNSIADQTANNIYDLFKKINHLQLDDREQEKDYHIRIYKDNKNIYRFWFSDYEKDTKSILKEINAISTERENTVHGTDKNNSKEKIMSDGFENIEEKDYSPKELAYMNMAHQRKVIADAIKAGTLSCLPGADGYADVTPAKNILNDNVYHGANLLYMKDHQKQNGFPTGEYITAYQIDNAKKDKPDLFIRQGQKGISIHVSEKNEETGNWEEKHIRLFNVAQVNKPKELKAWIEQKKEEKAQEKLEYLQSQYGTEYKPPEQKTKEPGPEIVCNSTEPEKYLGQYLAAVSMGGKFKVSPEQAAEFSEKMTNVMYEKLRNKETGEFVLGKSGEPVSNLFKLEEVSRNANKECRDFMRDLRIDSQKQNQPEQKQEQAQGVKR